MLHSPKIAPAGTACIPGNVGIAEAYQYEEVGSDPNTPSNQVTLLFDAEAGVTFDLWVVTSALGKNLDALAALADQAETSAQNADASARDAASSAEASATSAGYADASASQAQTAADTVSNAISVHDASGTAHSDIRQDITALDTRVDGLENLGHYVGTFDTFADIPINAGGFVTITPNDFVNVRADENHGGSMTRYVAEAIGDDGAITWAYDISYDVDVSGKADKVSNAVSGNVATLDAEGNLADGGVALADLSGLAVASRSITSLTASLAANADFTVPPYAVGSNRLCIWYNGARCTPGSDPTIHQYTEVGELGSSSTTVRFYDALDANSVILAEVK